MCIIIIILYKIFSNMVNMCDKLINVLKQINILKARVVLILVPYPMRTGHFLNLFSIKVHTELT